MAWLGPDGWYRTAILMNLGPQLVWLEQLGWLTLSFHVASRSPVGQFRLLYRVFLSSILREQEQRQQTLQAQALTLAQCHLTTVCLLKQVTRPAQIQRAVKEPLLQGVITKFFVAIFANCLTYLLLNKWQLLLLSLLFRIGLSLEGWQDCCYYLLMAGGMNLKESSLDLPKIADTCNSLPVTSNQFKLYSEEAWIPLEIKYS